MMKINISPLRHFCSLTIFFHSKLQITADINFLACCTELAPAVEFKKCQWGLLLIFIVQSGYNKPHWPTWWRYSVFEVTPVSCWNNRESRSALLGTFDPLMLHHSKRRPQDPSAWSLEAIKGAAAGIWWIIAFFMSSTHTRLGVLILLWRRIHYPPCPV